MFLPILFFISKKLSEIFSNETMDIITFLQIFKSLEYFDGIENNEADIKKLLNVAMIVWSRMEDKYTYI